MQLKYKSRMMNICDINPCLILTKPIFVIIFHPYVSVSKVARVDISSINSDKNIFLFQVKFLVWLWRLSPKFKCFLNFFSKVSLLFQYNHSRIGFKSPFSYLILCSRKFLTFSASSSKEASFIMKCFLSLMKRSSYFYEPI